MKSADDRPIYILQTIKHKMLIEIIPYDDESELNYSTSDVFDLFSFSNSDGFDEHYMLKVVDFFGLSSEEIDLYILELRLHLLKAWKWYKSYLIWEDAQIDLEGDTDNYRLN